MWPCHLCILEDSMLHKNLMVLLLLFEWWIYNYVIIETLGKDTCNWPAYPIQELPPRACHNLWLNYLCPFGNIRKTSLMHLQIWVIMLFLFSRYNFVLMLLNYFIPVAALAGTYIRVGMELWGSQASRAYLQVGLSSFPPW